MKFFIPLLALASSVAAHGYVNYTFTAGNKYTGFLPDYDNWQTPDPLRITRRIPDDGPVFDYTSTNLTCNVGAEDAQWRTSSHALVNAGDDFTFAWVRWPTDHLGPITVWMAACGTSCTDFDATGNVWFKIDQMGLVSGETDTGVWASSLLIKNNLMWTVTIPPTLQPGAYLLRMEILALHSAGAPQFYPSCQQIVLTGNGTASPSADEMVAIPGYYTNDTSTNIDIWTNGQTTYPIAGPALTSLAAYNGSNPYNSNGGIGNQTTLVDADAKVVTSSTASSSSASNSTSSSVSSSSGSNSTSTSDDSGSSSDDDASSDDTGASTNGTVTNSAAPATTSSPSKSCSVTRRRRDLRRQAEHAAHKTKKRHSAKRRLTSY